MGQSINEAFKKASSAITKIVDDTLQNVTKEVTSRSYKASNELRKESQYVLRGKRSGKEYRVPFTRKKYRASAPGEAPAVRTGVFRLSWGTRVNVEKSGKTYKAVSAIESGVKTPSGKPLGELLENGSDGGRLQPRPYKEAVIDRAKAKIKEIYNRPYI